MPMSGGFPGDLVQILSLGRVYLHKINGADVPNI